MATHEAGIVNQMRRRVVEISAGKIVRDESEGVYRVGGADTVIETTSTSVVEAVMETKQVLYSEPVVEDEVTREADRITAAATAQIPVQDVPVTSGPIVIPGADDAAEQLTLAERLGLRMPSSDTPDDEQEVGPTR